MIILKKPSFAVIKIFTICFILTFNNINLHAQLSTSYKPISLATAQPDSGDFTFWLRWDTNNTDLDLYMIVPDPEQAMFDTLADGSLRNPDNGNPYDTLYWANSRLPSGAYLDVDDNDGYGPEKIFHPRVLTGSNTYAQIAAYYYGPQKGKPSKVWLDVYRGDYKYLTLGPCTLNPKNWWNVFHFNLYNGTGYSNSQCDTTSIPELSERRK